MLTKIGPGWRSRPDSESGAQPGDRYATLDSAAARSGLDLLTRVFRQSGGRPSGANPAGMQGTPHSSRVARVINIQREARR